MRTIKVKLSILLAFFAIIFSSCGTTIITCKRSDASIYVDGQKIGEKEVTIKRMGTPHKALIQAKLGDNIIGETLVPRKFDGITFLIGIATYYTGFFWALRYPKDIEIPLNIETPINRNSPSKESIWKRAPNNYNKK